jgi:hypothetical protein
LISRENTLESEAGNIEKEDKAKTRDKNISSYVGGAAARFSKLGLRPCLSPVFRHELETALKQVTVCIFLVNPELKIGASLLVQEEVAE